jgi:hypothetical protein
VLRADSNAIVLQKPFSALGLIRAIDRALQPAAASPKM